jgi:hypothetical protein
MKSVEVAALVAASTLVLSASSGIGVDAAIH